MPPVRRLTAILAADVAGHSRLMGADEEGRTTGDLGNSPCATISAIQRLPRGLSRPESRCGGQHPHRTAPQVSVGAAPSLTRSLRCEVSHRASPRFATVMIGDIDQSGNAAKQRVLLAVRIKAIGESDLPNVFDQGDAILFGELFNDDAGEMEQVRRSRRALCRCLDEPRDLIGAETESSS
jgi:hypothetical protein